MRTFLHGTIVLKFQPMAYIINDVSGSVILLRYLRITSQDERIKLDTEYRVCVQASCSIYILN